MLLPGARRKRRTENDQEYTMFDRSNKSVEQHDKDITEYIHAISLRAIHKFFHYKIVKVLGPARQRSG